MSPTDFTTLVAETVFEVALEMDYAGMADQVEGEGIGDSRAYIRSLVVELAIKFEKSKYATRLAEGELPITWYDVVDALVERLNEDCISPVDIDSLIERLIADE